MAPKTTIFPRRGLIPDQELYLRNVNAAPAPTAITTAGGDFTAPDAAEAAFQFDVGETMTRLVFTDIAYTPNAAADNVVYWVLVGQDLAAAPTKRRVLGVKQLGVATATAHSDDTLASGEQHELFFTNVFEDDIFEFGVLETVITGTGGGALSLQFSALLAGNFMS